MNRWDAKCANSSWETSFSRPKRASWEWEAKKLLYLKKWLSSWLKIDRILPGHKVGGQRSDRITIDTAAVIGQPEKAHCGGQKWKSAKEQRIGHNLFRCAHGKKEKEQSDEEVDVRGKTFHEKARIDNRLFVVRRVHQLISWASLSFLLKVIKFIRKWMISTKDGFEVCCCCWWVEPVSCDFSRKKRIIRSQPALSCRMDLSRNIFKVKNSIEAKER